jgi:hypothetical protein
MIGIRKLVLIAQLDSSSIHSLLHATLALTSASHAMLTQTQWLSNVIHVSKMAVSSTQPKTCVDPHARQIRSIIGLLALANLALNQVNTLTPLLISALLAPRTQ